MSLKFGLLGLLNYGKMTGYELDKAFKESLHFFWQAQTSQVYRELNAMEKEGWLTSELVYQEGKPNKKVYAITEQGRAALHRWLSEEDTGGAFPVRSAFLMKIFFAGEVSREKAISMLEDYKEKCLASLEALKDTARSIHHYSQLVPDREKAVYWQATANFGRHYYEMCVRWAEETIKTLEGSDL
ncbi:MAG TPA: PadR family transcriptional regulator [Clostridia bacterium]|nr:PadR family transcriptional regulator [Clostridia bacterium]